MHKFMRTVGFGKCQNEPDMDKLLKLLAKAADINTIVEEGGNRLYELRTEIAPGIGIAMAGRMNSRGTFSREYYFPYVLSDDISSTAECSIQRHAERETFAGLLDEYRVGISLIFYMENSLEFRNRIQSHLATAVSGVCLSGLSVQGKILFPVQKTRQQTEALKQAANKRSLLLEAAKRGDENAIETLTVEDIDLYTTVSRRVLHEDIYSIIETCFMPCGVECDQYSIIGDIVDLKRYQNHMTDEEIYLLKLNCNDITFSVAINKKDLLGEPMIGRRFKGQVWMQGTVRFKG